MIRPLSSSMASQVEAGVQSKPSADKSSKAAKDFEAIFVRKILSCLEKGSGAGALNAGDGMYGAMMVGALADAIVDAGGLGLADQLQHKLSVAEKNAASAGLKGAETDSAQASSEPSALERQSRSR